MIIEKKRGAHWPDYKRYVDFSGVVSLNSAIKWRSDTKVKCLFNQHRAYFTTEKDALFFVLRWS